MKIKPAYYLAAVIILGLVLLTISCGGKAPAEEKPITPAPPTPAIETPAEKPAAKELPPPPTAKGSPIPHAIKTQTACFVCHAEGKPTPLPADHARLRSDTCLDCHEPVAGVQLGGN